MHEDEIQSIYRNPEFADLVARTLQTARELGIEVPVNPTDQDLDAIFDQVILKKEQALGTPASNVS